MPKAVASGLCIMYINVEGLHMLMVCYVRKFMDVTYITEIQIDYCIKSTPSYVCYSMGFAYVSHCNEMRK